ncbi:hypothetical protein BJF93_20290 [Xaviernesmea oryzae]|uniref:Co-chaperone DjlA N-terminal domain-containing protein n=1 Tax=Xaviernesmea oryzae TaxID=464029 RepID=A0A1Q9AVS2_9HYPH|nr:TerB family tellurite resistance protein [Xaviernesmea oryzae]OLP59560.1 hypothetical protein BJF93_20290 [Xaviernesmea oryzae]SEM13428.1 Uncharacterized conserved protein, tellurite resistance protein B (TerB) family [Xaviernesmea oryzae]
MFERLHSFIETLTGPATPGPLLSEDYRVAIIALCLQVMEADGIVSQAEQETMRRKVMETFDLDATTFEALLAAGTDAESVAIDYFRFTSEIKRHLSEEQCVDLIGLLWEIVYADGSRSEMEDHVIWRIADLLGVSGRDRIMKRQEVASRAHEPEAGADVDG